MYAFFIIIIIFGTSLRTGYAQDASAQRLTQSLLWEIAGNGLPNPSYIFGTFHTQDASVFKFSDSVLTTIQKTDCFAMEIIPDSLFTLSSMAQMMEALQLPDNKTLKNYYSKRKYRKLEKSLTNRLPIPLNMLQRFRPLMIMMLLQQQQLHNDSSLALDEWLLKKAKEYGKQCYGIETVAEQLQALVASSLPESEAKTLYEVATNPKKQTENIELLLSLYKNGDLESLYRLEEDEKGFSEQQKTALLDKRNDIMFNRLQPRLHNCATFIAVGALHLPGPSGLIQLFRTAGYQVRPIK